MELIWTNGKRDSGTKFASPEVCIPFAPTVNQGDTRYTRSIYSLSYRSIVWSSLCYWVRARGHCCVLCDVTRDLPFTWYICTSREPTGFSTQMVKNQRSTQVLLLRIRHTRSYIGLKSWLPLGKIIRKIKHGELKSEFIFSLISYEYIVWIHLIDYILNSSL